MSYTHMYIENDGQMVFFDGGASTHDDTNKHTFVQRCWFIAKRMKHMTIDSLYLYANIWIQKKNLGVVYTDDIEKQLHQVVQLAPVDH